MREHDTASMSENSQSSARWCSQPALCAEADHAQDDRHVVGLLAVNLRRLPRLLATQPIMAGSG
jgi:hypothetical protein